MKKNKIDDFEAKKIYFDCDGSLFYMSRNGLEEKYLSFEIDENTELKWQIELIDLRMSEFIKSSKFMKLHTLIENEKYKLIKL